MTAPEAMQVHAISSEQLATHSCCFSGVDSLANLSFRTSCRDLTKAKRSAFSITPSSSTRNSSCWSLLAKAVHSARTRRMCLLPPAANLQQISIRSTAQAYNQYGKHCQQSDRHTWTGSPLYMKARKFVVAACSCGISCDKKEPSWTATPGIAKLQM